MALSLVVGVQLPENTGDTEILLQKSHFGAVAMSRDVIFLFFRELRSDRCGEKMHILKVHASKANILPPHRTYILSKQYLQYRCYMRKNRIRPSGIQTLAVVVLKIGCAFIFLRRLKTLNPTQTN